MEYTQESLRELAERIYDLDAEVYSCLGSSLGRVFNRDRERCVTELLLDEHTAALDPATAEKVLHESIWN